jgi:hypothetical protein
MIFKAKGLLYIIFFVTIFISSQCIYAAEAKFTWKVGNTTIVKSSAIAIIGLSTISTSPKMIHMRREAFWHLIFSLLPFINSIYVGWSCLWYCSNLKRRVYWVAGVKTTCRYVNIHNNSCILCKM